jgi:hypothetical protein
LPNYLHELFSANNLPNILLFFAGSGAIAVGIYTLRDIRTQTRLLREYVTATKDGVEATRRNIALQFRPKIIVRRAELEFGSLEIGGKPAKIHYTVANIGGTEGRITKLQGAFAYWNAPGFWGNPSRGNRISPDAYSQGIDMQLSVNLSAGEDQTLTTEADQIMFDKVKFVQMRSGHNVTNPSLVGEIRICVEIHYTDGEKITRKTGIYRWLDIGTMRFKPIDDKEYEYQDEAS